MEVGGIQEQLKEVLKYLEGKDKAQEQEQCGIDDELDSLLLSFSFHSGDMINQWNTLLELSHHILPAEFWNQGRWVCHPQSKFHVHQAWAHQ